MKNIRYPICLALYTSLFALCSCKSNDKEEIVLKILNPEVYSYGYEYESGNVVYDKNSKQVIRYSITNNSTTTYYFNHNVLAKKQHYGIGVADMAELIIQDNKDSVIEPRYSISDPSEEYFNFLQDRERGFEQIVEDMGYEPRIYPEIFLNNKSFFIDPNETLYFEDVLSLPGNHRRGEIKFDKDRKYNARLEIFSDSTTYKKDNTRAILKTIQTNGYKVFHGTIKSDKVPVTFKPLD